MSSEFKTVNRTEIIRYETLIRPYVRRTPVIEIDGADIGVGSKKLLLKLELFQHSGSFKARGARECVPSAEHPKVRAVRQVTNH